MPNLPVIGWILLGRVRERLCVDGDLPVGSWSAHSVAAGPSIWVKVKLH